MDSVYSMLINEQKKVKEKKQIFNKLVKEQASDADGTLHKLKAELSMLRDAYNRLRQDVRYAVEGEVKQMFQTKYSNLDKLYSDVPRQIDTQMERKMKEADQ